MEEIQIKDNKKMKEIRAAQGTKLVKGTKVFLKGREAKLFLPNEMLFIYDNLVGISGKDKFRHVINNGNIVKWVNQKYIHIRKR